MGHTFQMRERSLGLENWLGILVSGTFLVYEITLFLCLWSFKFNTRKEATKLSVGATVRDNREAHLKCLTDAGHLSCSLHVS